MALLQQRMRMPAGSGLGRLDSVNHPNLHSVSKWCREWYGDCDGDAADSADAELQKRRQALWMLKEASAAPLTTRRRTRPL